MNRIKYQPEKVSTFNTASWCICYSLLQRPPPPPLSFSLYFYLYLFSLIFRRRRLHIHPKNHVWPFIRFGFSAMFSISFRFSISLTLIMTIGLSALLFSSRLHCNNSISRYSWSCTHVRILKICLHIAIQQCMRSCNMNIIIAHIPTRSIFYKVI